MISMRYDKTLSIRIGTYQYAQLVKRANKADMTLGEYIRHIINLGEAAYYDAKPGSTVDW